MFFEGSEKKVELIVKSGSKPLRALGEQYWKDIVAKCNAEVLSIISNDHIDAYLLSESSLFVWDDRFLMITCGNTVLVNSVLEFARSYDPSEVECLTFQRKNEYDSRGQITSFTEDLEKLRDIFPGVALRFGKLDGHYNYLFHLDKEYKPATNDYTTEFLMYHIEGEGADILRSENQSIEVIRDLLGLEQALPEAQFDDFLFEPFGYSMNAIFGDCYLTMHITPQEDSSYVSFETDLDLEKYSELIPTLVKRLNPGSFDLVTFNVETKFEKTSDYLIAGRSKDTLKCGFEVDFKHYLRKDEKIRKAVVL